VCESECIVRFSINHNEISYLSPLWEWVPTRDTRHDARITSHDQWPTRHATPPLSTFLTHFGETSPNRRTSDTHTAHRKLSIAQDKNRRVKNPGVTGSRGKPLRTAHSLLPPQLHLLLLEVSPVLLVDEHQIEEVFNRELIVDVLERWCQVFEPACVQTHTSVGARERA